MRGVFVMLLFGLLLLSACTTYPAAPQEILDLCEQSGDQWCFDNQGSQECDENLDLCLMRLAYATQDATICPHVGGDVGEENCFYNVARATGDEELCKYTGFQKDLCIERLAKDRLA